MYQFWLNTDDADVVDRLKVFTFLSRAEIEELAARHAEAPFKREGQKTVAYLVTSLVHGVAATDAAVAATDALFNGGALDGLDAATLEAAVTALPHTTAPASTSVTQLLVDTGLSPSLSAARRSLAEGGVYLNNVKVEDEAVTVGSHVLAGRMAVIRRGKKTLAGVFVE
jgi:tyrosyl-tRNA synthetase